MAAACAGYDLRSGRPCDQAAAREVTAGCVHEHLGPRDLCDWHLDDLTAGRMKCGNCAMAGHADCTLRELSRHG